MTVNDFAAITRRVIERDGLDGFLPTACYPDRREIRALEGLPDDVEPKQAVLKWAAKSAVDGEEFLVAFRSGQSEFTVIRQHGKKRETAKFKVEDA
jgi:hypothetical protein